MQLLQTLSVYVHVYVNFQALGQATAVQVSDLAAIPLDAYSGHPKTTQPRTTQPKTTKRESCMGAGGQCKRELTPFRSQGTFSAEQAAYESLQRSDLCSAALCRGTPLWI